MEGAKTVGMAVATVGGVRVVGSAEAMVEVTAEVTVAARAAVEGAAQGQRKSRGTSWRGRSH